MPNMKRKIMHLRLRRDVDSPIIAGNQLWNAYFNEQIRDPEPGR